MVNIDLVFDLLHYIEEHELAEAAFRRCVEKGVFADRDTFYSKRFVWNLEYYSVNAIIGDLLMYDDNKKALDTFVSRYGIEALEQLYNNKTDSIS